jgi:cation diffusion facilitator family transporter
LISSEKEALTRIALIAGVIDLVITLIALLAARSSVLLADFLKTCLEFLAVYLAWLAIRSITKGGQGRFEYGLEKLENLSSLLVGTLMVLVFLIIVSNSAYNILNPRHVEGAGVWISMASQVVYGAINARLIIQLGRIAKKGKSPIVDSQRRLLFTKAVGNAFILISLSLSLLLQDFGWSVYIDPAASLVIAGAILMSAIGVFTSSFYDLLDRTLEEADQIALLRVLATQFDHYDDMHGIRSRRAGGKEFIEIFLGSDPEKCVRDVQVSMDTVRHAIQERFPDASVLIVLADKDISLWGAPA